MFRPLSKLAEPPPPKGVSTKEWDKILQSGASEGSPAKEAGATSSVSVEDIRRTAAKLAFEEFTAPEAGPTTYELIMLQKAAQVEDPELFKTAARLRESPDAAFELYEALGGTFRKEAIGTPMFQVAGAGPAPKPAQPSVGALGRAGASTGSLPTAGGGKHAIRPAAAPKQVQPAAPATPAQAPQGGATETPSIGLAGGQ